MTTLIISGTGLLHTMDIKDTFEELAYKKPKEFAKTYLLFYLITEYFKNNKDKKYIKDIDKLMA